MPPKTTATPQHIGRKIEKLRHLKGIKQGDLAKQIGIVQSALSTIEQSETVDEDKLQKIADALQMSVEAIKDFNADAVVNYIQNNHEKSSGNIQGTNTQIFNPIEKYAEAVEENKKLYERLLQNEQEKIKYLEAMLKK